MAHHQGEGTIPRVDSTWKEIRRDLAERYKKREPRKKFILYILYITYLIYIYHHLYILYLLYILHILYILYLLSYIYLISLIFIVISRLLLIIRKPPSIRLLYPWFYTYHWCTINISNIITWSLGQPFTHRRANSVYIIWIWRPDIIRGPD